MKTHRLRFINTEYADGGILFSEHNKSGLRVEWEAGGGGGKGEMNGADLEMNIGA